MMLQNICLAAGFTFVNTTGTPNCSMAIVEIGKIYLRFFNDFRRLALLLVASGNKRYVIWRKSMIWTVAVLEMTVFVRSPTYRSVVSGTKHRRCKYPFVGLY
ncbi:hypothetical protein BJ912DRAFT_963539 [Pholiota molesta]|nr:hypothetical protein BJ912DRAFT_963539 [Pholiota molesta]